MFLAEVLHNGESSLFVVVVEEINVSGSRLALNHLDVLLSLSLGEVLNDRQNCFLVVLMINNLDIVSLNVGVDHLNVRNSSLIRLLLWEVLNDSKGGLLAIVVGISADASDVLLDLVHSLRLPADPFKLILLLLLLAIDLHSLVLIRLFQLQEGSRAWCWHELLQREERAGNQVLGAKLSLRLSSL